MIVVTAPTGKIGRQVLAGVLEANVPVRVIVRDAGKLPDSVRTRIEVIEGSHGDADVVGRAFADADSVFWLAPPDPRAATVDEAYAGFTRPAAEALKRHRVKRVVDISALGRDRKMPTCATRDIAATACRLLLDGSWGGTGHVAVLGPEDLSFNDMAAIMGEVLDKPIRYEQVSLEASKAGFIDRGMSDAMAQGLADMAWAKNEGLDNAEPRTPENTTPTSFRQWCEEELKPIVHA